MVSCLESKAHQASRARLLAVAFLSVKQMSVSFLPQAENPVIKRKLLTFGGDIDGTRVAACHAGVRGELPAAPEIIESPT
jgi:hypothetical protein